MIRAVVAAFVAITLAFPARAAVDIQEVTSPGGITAWLVEEPSIPFVALELRFRGGTSLDAPGKRGATSLMVGLLEEGAGDLDAQGFARATEALAALVAAVHAFLAETPSDLVLLQTTDLATETEPVNVPGTDREWPNWRQRLGHALTRTELAARLPEAYRARGLTTAPGPQSPQSPEPAAPTSGPEE